MRIARKAVELDAAAVLALKTGDHVWLIGPYSSSTPQLIGTVVRTTNSRVVLMVDHSINGGGAHERKFHRLPLKWGSVGYEVGHRSFADRLYMKATASEVEAFDTKIRKAASDRRAHKLAELNREETTKLLNALLPQSCYAQVETTGLINVQITNLKSVEQVQKLAVILNSFLVDRPVKR